MAVDVYATSQVSTSPRISFSHDLKDPDSIYTDSLNPTRSDPLLLSPTFDFDFRTASNLTPADELFSNGKLLPTQIKKPQFVQIPDTKTRSINPNSDTQKKQLKELIQDQDQDQDPERDQEHEKSSLRSFWQFRRSASYNCDNGKGSKGLLRSLSVKSLARSHSTGSALNTKRNSGQKLVGKTKDPMLLRRCSSLNQAPPPPPPVYYSYQNSNKSCKGGIRIIPVLNIPPAYNISKGTINFFGFGFFCNGKVKKKTKS